MAGLDDLFATLDKERIGGDRQRYGADTTAPTPDPAPVSTTNTDAWKIRPDNWQDNIGRLTGSGATPPSVTADTSHLNGWADSGGVRSAASPSLPPGMVKTPDGQIVPIGGKVPNMPGFVYNWAGGYEPDGSGSGSTPPAGGTSGSPLGAWQPATTAGIYTKDRPDANVSRLVSDFIASKGLQANQSDPSSLKAIVDHLRSQGINANYYTDQNGHTSGIQVDGKEYQLIDGSNRWTALQPWEDSGGGGGYRDYGAGLDDPATANLMQLISERIRQLMSPINDPAQAQFEELLRKRMAELGMPMQTPQGTQDFQKIIKDTIAKLQGPTFSDPELANMQTRAFDTLNRQEQAEIENTTRTLANHGVDPSSGIVSNAIQKVRNKYEELRGQQQQGLNQYTIDSAAQRRAQLLQTAQTGSNLDLGLQQTAEGRKDQIQSLAMQLVELARAARGEAGSNADKAITFAGVPVDITERRIINAANMGQGGTGQAGNIAATLSNLIAGFNNQSGQNQANSANYWQNLSSYLSQIDWSKVFK